MPNLAIDPILLQQPFVLRRGLGFAAQTFRSASAATVAFLGGSITWGGNASDIDRCSYRALTSAWLQKTFPACRIQSINAGVGGTNSELGAVRLKDDVLALEPDLVFVEFAVNDGGRPEADCAASIEGIVRQLLRQEKIPDICFVYTLAQEHLEIFERNELPPTFRAHDSVAAHYGIPAINLALPVARRVARKELDWNIFALDTVHPTDAGHAMYFETMRAALTAALETHGTSARGALPEPLSPDAWERVRIVDVPKREGAFAGWSFRPLVKKAGWDCFSGLFESNQTGSEAVFEFEGTQLGLYYQLAPDVGHILCAIDGGEFQTVKVFDQFCLDCIRPQHRVIEKNLAPGRHTLRVRVGEGRDERSKGNWIRLASVFSR